MQTRIEWLREQMRTQNIDVALIANSDPFLSEVAMPSFRIIPWLTGFTGSAATVLITADRAGLWTDGRYAIQARTQLEGTGVTPHITTEPGTPTIADVLATLPDSLTVGTDARLLSRAEYCALLEGVGQLIALDFRPVEAWPTRPAMPDGEVVFLSDEEAGATVAEKLKEMRETLRQAEAEGLLITSAEDVNWLFQFRGSDLPDVPIVQSYAYLTESEAVLFTTDEHVEDLQNGPVAQHASVRSMVDFEIWLDEIPAETRVWIDPMRTNAFIYERLQGRADLLENPSPVTLAKAQKNDAEIAQLNDAWRKDGVALTRFFRWLEEEGVGKTEVQLGDRLLAFRAEQEGFLSPSFNTIAGYAANGAIVHYSAGKDAATVEAKGLLLLDSGGQYTTGTTDITRTVAMGPLTEEEKRDYTLVLKSHIALTTAQFPVNTRGIALDAIARAPMWQHGENYAHGTGHGVGFRLAVHEGPYSISFRHQEVGILPGMTLSIEPGLYRAGKHGVRIENIALVVPGDAEGYLRFEPLTFCYIDTTPVVPEMLTAEEMDWLNRYNYECFERLEPHLEEADRAFLHEKTRPIR